MNKWKSKLKSHPLQKDMYNLFSHSDKSLSQIQGTYWWYHSFSPWNHWFTEFYRNLEGGNLYIVNNVIHWNKIFPFIFVHTIISDGGLTSEVFEQSLGYSYV